MEVDSSAGEGAELVVADLLAIWWFSDLATFAELVDEASPLIGEPLAGQWAGVGDARLTAVPADSKLQRIEAVLEDDAGIVVEVETFDPDGSLSTLWFDVVDGRVVNVRS